MKNMNQNQRKCIEPNRTEQEREGSEKTRFYISVIWLFFICTSVIAKVFAYFSKKKKNRDTNNNVKAQNNEEN